MDTAKPLNAHSYHAPAGCLPPLLVGFLQELNTTATSQDVWDLLVALARDTGVTVVDYICATDFQNWEQVQFIRTTIDSSWIEHAQDNANVRKYSTFRQYSVHHLVPICVGLAYAEEDPDLPPELLTAASNAVEFGVNTGLAIPLRMEVPGQAAHILFGSAHDIDGFEDILSRHGWTLHAAALSAHTRYTELFKSEFIERNNLTEKQRELLTLLGQGMLDKQIAHALGISFSTVRQRLSLIQTKTGISNRAELAALAMRIGLVADPMLKRHTSELTVFLSTGDGRQGKETRT